MVTVCLLVVRGGALEQGASKTEVGPGPLGSTVLGGVFVCYYHKTPKVGQLHKEKRSIWLTGLEVQGQGGVLSLALVKASWPKVPQQECVRQQEVTLQGQKPEAKERPGLFSF